MKRMRVYVDTSVFGGCFDDEFREQSLMLMDMAKDGQIQMLISDLLLRELEMAPEKVKNLLLDLSDNECAVENIALSQEAEDLRNCYLDAEVVGKAQMNDALHVALATVARADLIVSWNFKHIVHFEKIRGFNAVNLRAGYMPIEIHSPREVV